MPGELKVYLDHLINRESFRYVRPTEKMRAVISSPTTKLTLKNLQDRSRAKLLRKPDFQRATWAWDAEDCVLLLDSIVNDQVIPSIIMWSSPSNGLDYILDGGHRVSVALAWLHDDWGDSPEAGLRSDTDEQAKIIRKAAKEVRELVEARIGTIEDYKRAEQEMYQMIENGGNPKQELDPITFRRGLFYQNLLKDNIGFNIQYVVGNYEIAEESFLKINKSGRELTDWEKILIQNRNSSFGRTVMSIANIKSAQHYWPSDQSPDETNCEPLKEKVDDILTNITAIHETLLKPEYRTPIRSLQQPFLVASEGDQKAFYLAQLLTIVAGGKGHEPETDELLKRDTNKSVEDIIDNGRKLTEDTIDVLNHLWTAFPDAAAPNQSLALVSPVYFYTNAGRPVRGLLYGFIYWMFGGDERTIRERKRIFSSYRGVFEQVYIESKEDIVSGFSRNIGSGSDITVPVARYFNKLLNLLIDHVGDIYSSPFLQAYAEVLNDLKGKKARATTSHTVRSRIFSPQQRSISLLSSLLTSAVRCEICGGILDPTGPIQHDHIQRVSEGGMTSLSNQRIVHPFCNQQRDRIEAIRGGQRTPMLPPFVDPDLDIGSKQLKLFDDSVLTPY